MPRLIGRAATGLLCNLQGRLTSPPAVSHLTAAERRWLRAAVSTHRSSGGLGEDACIFTVRELAVQVRTTR